MAGIVSDQAIEDIKRRTSLVSLIGEYVTLKKAGRSHKGLCPFHGEKSASFHVHEAEGYYYCFGCQAKGDAITFLREHIGYSFPEAVQVLADKVGIALTLEEQTPALRQQRQRRRESRDRAYDVNQIAQAFFQSQLKGSAADDYLRSKRALKPETIQRYQLGFAPESWDQLVQALGQSIGHLRDAQALGLVASRRQEGSGYYAKFRNRVMFPVFALDGRIAGFAGRTLSQDKETPKYVNSSDSEVFQKGSLLYGLRQAREQMRPMGRGIVVEGQVDVLTMAESGFGETVAPMGTALTEDQCALLKRFTPHVVLVYDGDDAGRAAALKAIPLLLRAGLSGQVVHLPDGEDPDTFLQKHGHEALEKQIQDALPLFDAWTQNAMREFDGSVPARAAVAQKVAPMYALLNSTEERDLYRRQLARNLGALESDIRRWMSSQPSPSRREVSPHERPQLSASQYGRAPTLEKKILQLILHHPELLPFWSARKGSDTITHDGVRIVLQYAENSFDTSQNLNVGELMDWLENHGLQAESQGIARIMTLEDPYGDQYERAFVEIADSLQVLVAERDRAARRARLHTLPVAEQLAMVQGELSGE